MKEPILTYMPVPSEAKFTLPSGATDSHVHIFGPKERFPYAETRSFTPVDAPKETLFAWHKKMGIDRCVIVNTLLHGNDNSVVEDAIIASKGRYLGIALVKTDVTDAELKRLSLAGFRGVRFHFMPGYAVHETPEQIIDGFSYEDLFKEAKVAHSAKKTSASDLILKLMLRNC